MTKLDFEKDRLKRKPKDIVTDAPWASDNPSARGPIKRDTKTRTFEFPPIKVANSSANPSASLLKRLGKMARILAGPDFSGLKIEKKLAEIAEIQRLLNLAVEREGPAIRNDPMYKHAEAACRRELRVLRTDS